MSEPIDTTAAWGLVTRLAAYAAVHRLSDAQLVRQLPMLGSARSWRRLAAQDWAAMPVEQWLPKLREAVAQIAGSDPLGSRPSALSSGDLPINAVVRHLNEADHCRRSSQPALARSHCRAARQVIEAYQRTFT